MKTIFNTKELKILKASRYLYQVFRKDDGDKDATFTQILESDGWGCVWSYMAEAFNDFSADQKHDLQLLAADYAERTIPIFNKRFPEDDRLQAAVNAARDYSNGLIGKETLSVAKDAAWNASYDAAMHGDDAAWMAGRSVSAAALAPIRGMRDILEASRTANISLDIAFRETVRNVPPFALNDIQSEGEWQKEKLLELFASWESGKAHYPKLSKGAQS